MCPVRSCPRADACRGALLRAAQENRWSRTTRQGAIAVMQGRFYDQEFEGAAFLSVNVCDRTLNGHTVTDPNRYAVFKLLFDVQDAAQIDLQRRDDCARAVALSFDDLHVGGRRHAVVDGRASDSDRFAKAAQLLRLHHDREGLQSKADVSAVDGHFRYSLEMRRRRACQTRRVRRRVRHTAPELAPHAHATEMQ